MSDTIGGLPRRYFWYARAKLLFCGVCKVGMKSLEQAFGDLPGGEMLLGLEGIRKVRPKCIAQFAREPRDRLVSMYEYFFSDTFRHPMPGMLEREVEDWYVEQWHCAWPDNNTFENFVLGLPRVADNHHFRNQWEEHGELADARIKLPAAQYGWCLIRNTYAPGLPILLPHNNKTVRKTGDVSDYFDELSDEAYDVYQELYGKDEQFYRDALPAVLPT